MAQHSSFRGLWFWVPVVLAVMWLGRCAQAAEVGLIATPRATLLTSSATNRPFLAAARAEQPVALDGYAETEFLVSGQASIYEWGDAAQGTSVSVRAANIPYATRILVRRPTDARKFSGLVVVELLDASELYDRAPLWGLSARQFLRHGDVWVGLTVRPSAMAALRRYDGVRYAGVGFSYRQPAGCTASSSDPRATPPDTESGLAWGAIAQVGALLRSSSKENPLLDLNPRHLVAAGYGLAGAYVTTYANAVHPLLRRGDGVAIYDGYLAAASARFIAPINQCAPPLPAGDPRRAPLPRDVPFVAVATESDFNLVPATRRDDSDAPNDLFRLYEIAGSAHAGPYPAGLPVAANLQIAGFAPAAADLCREPRSDFPAGLAFNAIWLQYAEWLASARPMASLPRIETLADSGARRDEAGNASGGWRLPQLEVPLARYASHSTPRDGNERASAACALTGAKETFDAAKLKSLYRDRASYLARFRAAVDRAIQERRLTPEDGAALKTPQGYAVPAF
jgi:hypothetical protein